MPTKIFLPVGSNPRQVGLNAHNQYRAVHNAPAMLLTSKLNNDAQQFADKLARESLFKHDPCCSGPSISFTLRGKDFFLSGVFGFVILVHPGDDASAKKNPQVVKIESNYSRSRHRIL